MYMYVLIVLLINPNYKDDPVIFSGLYAEFQTKEKCNIARLEIDKLPVPVDKHQTSFCLKAFRAIHL